MKREDIIQNLLYGFLLSAFLLLYFILSMNSRLVADDFFFLKNFEDHGWWQSMVISWNVWVTRWASILGLNFIFILYKLTGNFLFFQISTLLMLCFALYRISSFSIDFLLKHRKLSPGLISISELPRHSRFTVSLLISFFFLTAGPGETFFWATSSSMYLWGFIAFCFLAAEVLREKQSFSSFLACIITACFVGGAAEAISIPAVFVLLIILAFQIRRKGVKATTIVSIAVLTASILVSYYGEGRGLRQSALPSHTLLQSFWITLKSIAVIELYYLKEKFLWIVLFFISWMTFAQRISLRIPFNLRIILIILSSYALLCFIFIFPACYLLGETPPHRAWILVGFLNCCMVSLGGIVTGSAIRYPRLISVVSSLAVLALLLLVGRVAVEQKQISSTYSHAVDARMQFLTTLVDPEDSTTIILDGLPPSGMLTSSEISVDSADFRNVHLKNYLRIKAGLRVK